MKLKKSIFLLLILTLALGTALAACGGGEEPADTEPTTDSTDSSDSSDSTDATSGEPTQGGTVTFAMYSAPAGIFNPLLYGDAYEANVIDMMYETLVTLDHNLSWEPMLAKDWSFENDHKTLVMDLRDDVTWHDGEKFTAEDVKFTYEVIGHPDYTGVRAYYVSNLVGAEEYYNGEADEITGLEIVNDYQIKFHFKEPNVLALSDASFIIVPKHVYENIPIATMKEAPESLDLDKQVGTGPFKATADWLAGEYYTFERNENYWGGAPYLDKVVWKVVNQDVAPSLLASGEIDIITKPGGVNPADFEYVSGLPGIKIHETPAFAYQYLGFKLHYRTDDDVANSKINPDNWIPNEKVQSVELRQAIAYAIDRQGLVDGLLEEHGTVMNAPFPPVSWAFDASVVNDYAHSPEKAKELLAAGGFKDVNGDGFVEDPNGKELVLKLDYPTGNKVRELSAPIIKEQLEAVGIKIDLRAPREAGSHFDAIEKDTQSEGMDMYLAGWSLATDDPNPIGIWAIKDAYNYNRWKDQKSQDLLDAAVKAPEAFDQEYRKEKYKEWAAYVNEQLPSVFLYSQNDIFAYNERIQNVQEGPTNITRHIHLWYVTE